MKKLCFLICASFFLLTGCSKETEIPESSAEIELRDNHRARPFHAEFSVSPEDQSDDVLLGFCDDQFGNFNIINPGTDNPDASATYLGNISFSSAGACIRPYIQDDPEVFPPAIYGDLLPFIGLFPVPGVVTNEVVWVSQNGVDEIHITFFGNTYPNPDDKFQSLIEATFEITGGAGRFEDATGEGTATGTASANFLAPIYPFTGTLDGEISF